MRRKTTLYFAIIDLAILFFIFYISTFLHHGVFTPDNFRKSDYIAIVTIITASKIGLYTIFGLYKYIWAHTYLYEFMKIIAVIFAMNLIIVLLSMVGALKIDSSVTIICLMAELLYFIVTRSGIRLFFQFKAELTNPKKLHNTLIVGAGNAGDMLYGDIKRNNKFSNRVIGFIDDDESKQGKVVRGKRILGTVNDIEQVIVDKNVKEVIIAIPSADKARIRDITEKVVEYGVSLKILPSIHEIVDRDYNGQLRDVSIEDLLGRDPIKLDTNGIYDFINQKTIMVTGGGGSIGSEICRQLVNYNPKKVVIFDIYENNVYELQTELHRYFKAHPQKYKPEIQVLIGSVRDYERLDEVMKEHKPDIVFHAAAHKHVPLMEDSPKEAVKNNIFGTYKTAKCAIENKVKKFVLISTDKAVNPTNVMGASKRFAEIIIEAFQAEQQDTVFSAVRFGNVLGSNGSVIPLFKQQIKEGGPITVTHKEITRFFMTIPEAVSLVIQSGAFANGGEKFILDMGTPVRIVELAENLIKLSGYEPYTEIDIQFTGLRPGEKMYEELLLDVTKQTKTENEKIFIENSIPPYSLRQIVEFLEQFETMEVIQWISECIDSYNKVDNNTDND